MDNVTPLIYNLEIERAIRRLDPFRPFQAMLWAFFIVSEHERDIL